MELVLSMLNLTSDMRIHSAYFNLNVLSANYLQRNFCAWNVFRKVVFRAESEYSVVEIPEDPNTTRVGFSKYYVQLATVRLLTGLFLNMSFRRNWLKCVFSNTARNIHRVPHVCLR